MNDVIKCPVPLHALGYDNRYILYPCGKVYDTKKNQFCTLHKNNYHLKMLSDGKSAFETVSLRKLYKQAYDELFVIDRIEDLDKENWLDISVIDKYKHLKGLYKISDLGRVKSYQSYNAIILKPYTIRGYQYVEIDQHNVRLNRLVLMAFHPTSDETLEAHHIDNNRSNNKLSNLSWLTKQQNIAQSYADRRKRQEDVSNENSLH